MSRSISGVDAQNLKKFMMAEKETEGKRKENSRALPTITSLIIIQKAWLEQKYCSKIDQVEGIFFLKLMFLYSVIQFFSNYT